MLCCSTTRWFCVLLLSSGILKQEISPRRSLLADPRPMDFSSPSTQVQCRWGTQQLKGWWDQNHCVLFSSHIGNDSANHILKCSLLFNNTFLMLYSEEEKRLWNIKGIQLKEFLTHAAVEQCFYEQTPGCWQVRPYLLCCDLWNSKKIFAVIKCGPVFLFNQIQIMKRLLRAPVRVLKFDVASNCS